MMLSQERMTGQNDRPTRWLALGENCLPDDILKRHGKKSFSTPFSSCRSNIDYALALDECDYATLLSPEGLCVRQVGSQKVVVQTRIEPCKPFYVQNSMQGFEFTHHDPLSSVEDRASFERKIARLISLRGSENCVFLYLHRMNPLTSLDHVRERLAAFSARYRGASNFVLPVLFFQTLLSGAQPKRGLEVSASGSLLEFNFHTPATWGGTDPDIFWARRDDDLVAEMIHTTDAHVAGLGERGLTETP
jgi:hypothetical protein